jgi:hypothetical protein
VSNPYVESTLATIRRDLEAARTEMGPSLARANVEMALHDIGRLERLIEIEREMFEGKIAAMRKTNDPYATADTDRPEAANDTTKGAAAE